MSVTDHVKNVPFATPNIEKEDSIPYSLLTWRERLLKGNKWSFFPMKAMLKWQLLTQKMARSCHTTCLNILGFVKGETKNFQNPDDELKAWPEEHSFQKLGHPSHATLDVTNDIIISLLSLHVFDADNHPFEATEPQPAPKKRNKHN